jgi:crossover junction endodeoxyribonuclease RuvC
MRILGIDPSLTCTGWATIENETIITSSTIKTKSKDDFLYRLHCISSFFKGFCEGMKEIDPYIDYFAIEDVFVNSKNLQTPIKLAKLHGTIVNEIMRAGFENKIKVYAPKFVKQTVTGNGSATKLQVLKMVKLITGYKGKSEDEADAIAVALTCLRDIEYKQAISKEVDKIY